VFSLGEPYYIESMLPKGYKVIIDWFQEVAEDPDYANPEMHNETRDMKGNIFESDDEDDEGGRGWKDGDFEEWVPLDKQRTGAILEEIKDDAEQVKDGAPKLGDRPDDQPHETVDQGSKAADAKENKPGTADENNYVENEPGITAKLAGGLKDLLANVTTTSVAGLKQTLAMRPNGAEEHKDATSTDKEVKPDVKEISGGDENAGTEDVN
jgi:hypothetical protein